MTISTFRRSSNSAPAVSIARSDRAHGDFHPLHTDPIDLRQRQRGFVDRPWTTLFHEHGNEIVRITTPGTSGVAGDGAITDLEGAVLSVWAGDCAPIVLVGVEREFAVVHAGWRGLAAGIVDRAFAAFREPVERVFLGPVIGPCCYEFGLDPARAVADGVHADICDIVRVGANEELRLDVAAAIGCAVTAHGVALQQLDDCTGCGHPRFSHRVRRDRQRHAVAAWQEVR